MYQQSQTNEAILALHSLAKNKVRYFCYKLGWRMKFCVTQEIQVLYS